MGFIFWSLPIIIHENENDETGHVKTSLSDLEGD